MAGQPFKITVVLHCYVWKKKIKTSSAGNFDPTNIWLNLWLRTVAPDLLMGLEPRLRRWTPYPAPSCRPSPSPAGLLPPVLNCAMRSRAPRPVAVHDERAVRSMDCCCLDGGALWKKLVRGQTFHPNIHFYGCILVHKILQSEANFWWIKLQSYQTGPQGFHVSVITNQS